ncbi:XRE family transcriptional regulator [Bifidobacterium simiiventris]|uniref:XRE family transcriptional regulator n=1 Tax=Bifidobacterium simiiventris TaxID=2834434 RepID=UPI001C571781|nr:XRE family transcriptional regulator [Bifidobacterium simiiventris]MBW3079664.1 XRE family transcriptional regulator [Bifidobacterium simiiventris]
MKTIAELRSIRIHASISQLAVASAMGTTQSALSRAEREGNPTQDFLQRYERALATILNSTNATATNAASDRDHPDSFDDSSSVLEIATIRFIVSKLIEKYGIADMYVFGSVARGDAQPDSDVDLLYRLRPDASHSLMTMQGLRDDLESALGRPASLTSYDSLLRSAQRSRASKRFLDHIAHDMVKVA